jgi:glycosyltransferase involved in cell wall biosynthesis
MKREKENFAKVDKIVVLNESFKELVLKRYDELREKIVVANLMSFKKGALSYDENSRKACRKKLGWSDNRIVCYVGHIYYSWQNISKTILLYKRLKDELYPDLKLLLIIGKKDHEIAIDFLNTHGIEPLDYILTQVPNTELSKYLNAADLGVLLRDFHRMNSIVTSGKLIDYLGCGLPVVTTNILHKLPEVIKEEGFGIVLNDLEIEKTDVKRLKPLFDFDSSKRKLISKWANDNLSLEHEIAEYHYLIKKHLR